MVFVTGSTLKAHSLQSAPPDRTGDLAAFDAAGPPFATIPWRMWSVLAAIAFAGSAIYGSSLALVFPQWRPGTGAVWLIASAGLSWVVFGPALILVTRRHALTCAYACLVTMAYGEAVLFGGLLLNLVGHVWANYPAFAVNASAIGVSNVVMAAVLVRQFQRLGVPAWKTTATWILGLNGTGAVLFWIFEKLLVGGLR